MRARPTVTTLVIDPQNPYKWGKVVDIDEEGADEHIDNLSEMYINERPFPWMSNVNYFVRSASIMMAAFSISWFDCFVASVDNSLLPV